MRNTGAAGRRSPGREIPHAQKAPAAVPDEQHGESGGSFLCACDAGGGWALPHDGSTTGPTAAARRRNRFSPVPDAEGRRFAGRRSPGREIPHARKTRSPRPPKHGKRSGRWAVGGVRRVGWEAREASAAVRGVRMPMRMRGTRHARYLQTLPQIFSAAAYPTQLFYVDILYTDILHTDILHTDILHTDILYVSILHIPTSLTPFSASHLPHITSSIPIPSFLLPIKKIYKRKPPLPFLPLAWLLRFAPVAPHLFAPLASLAWRSGASDIFMSSEDSTGACACVRA